MSNIVFCSGSLTGYGFTFGLRSEFDPVVNRHGFAETEELGPIDAPCLLAAGGMRSGNETTVQLFSDRDAA